MILTDIYKTILMPLVLQVVEAITIPKNEDSNLWLAHKSQGSRFFVKWLK